MKTPTTLGLLMSTILAVTTATPVSADMAPLSGGLRSERNAFVHVADLDLTRWTDAQTLYERIRYAARTICTADELSFDVKRALHWQQCVQSAVDGAVAQTHAPLLRAIHLDQRAELARL